MGEVEWTRSGLDTLDDLEPLSGYPYYKLRVGDYRVLIDWDRETDTLYVGAVAHRRNVYDRHLPP